MSRKPPEHTRPETDCPEDESLVSRALDGDDRAYSELFDRYRISIFHVVVKIVSDPDDAADVVQETFIKAFRALGTYRQEYRFSTWLYRIAANAAIDHIRRQRMQELSMDAPVRSDEGLLEREFPSKSKTPAQRLVEAEQKEAIDAAIESLPDKYRRVIVLRHQQERSYEEIADILDVPVGTVKIRIFRAREMLRRKLRNLAP